MFIPSSPNSEGGHLAIYIRWPAPEFLVFIHTLNSQHAPKLLALLEGVVPVVMPKTAIVLIFTTSIRAGGVNPTNNLQVSRIYPRGLAVQRYS